MLKIGLLFKKFTNFTGNNSRIYRIKNTKFLGYFFHINTNIHEDFQICISVSALHPPHLSLSVSTYDMDDKLNNRWILTIAGELNLLRKKTRTNVGDPF